MGKAAYRIVRKPLVTEKNMFAAETSNEYAFEVDMRANKIQVRIEIENLFNVKVVRVRTMVRKGLTRRVGMNWTTGPSFKKAIVKLAEGYKIDLL
jgi:large subunit ribosomal protein L23